MMKLEKDVVLKSFKNKMSGVGVGGFGTMLYAVINIDEFVTAVNKASEAEDSAEAVRSVISAYNAEIVKRVFKDFTNPYAVHKIVCTVSEDKLVFRCFLVPIPADNISNTFVEMLIKANSKTEMKRLVFEYFGKKSVNGWYASQLYTMRPDRFVGKKNQRDTAINERYFRSQLTKALFYAGMNEKPANNIFEN